MTSQRRAGTMVLGLIRAVLIAALLSSAACASVRAALPGAGQDDEHSVTTIVVAGSGTDVSSWHGTWEAAALDEANRLHPSIDDLSVRRISIDGIGERIVVEGSGNCWLYGGMMLKGRWRANELGEC